MTIENKYYIPDIKEFRPGFEYEITNGYEWVEKKFSKLDLKSFLYGELENGIKQEYIRVKYLDRQDIESVNFGKKFTERQVLFGDEVWTYQKHIGICTYRINYWSNDCKCVIEIHNDETMNLNEFHQIFNGNIKNISVLKEVLEMIGVDYE